MDVKTELRRRKDIKVPKLKPNPATGEVRDNHGGTDMHAVLLNCGLETDEICRSYYERLELILRKICEQRPLATDKIPEAMMILTWVLPLSIFHASSLTLDASNSGVIQKAMLEVIDNPKVIYQAKAHWPDYVLSKYEEALGSGKSIQFPLNEAGRSPFVGPRYIGQELMAKRELSDEEIIRIAKIVYYCNPAQKKRGSTEDNKAKIVMQSCVQAYFTLAKKLPECTTQAGRIHVLRPMAFIELVKNVAQTFNLPRLYKTDWGAGKKDEKVSVVNRIARLYHTCLQEGLLPTIAE